MLLQLQPPTTTDAMHIGLLDLLPTLFQHGQSPDFITHSNQINKVPSLVAKVTAQPAHRTEQTPGKVLAYYSRQRAARR